MTESELKEKAWAIEALIKDTNTADEAIIEQIKETPEIVNVKLRTGKNLFVAAIAENKISVAKAVKDMGADIHWECSACSGNALNAADSPQIADEVLAMGVKIEKELLLSKPYRNPAVTAAERNDKKMLFYWLNKQKKLFADDEKYVKELLYATIETASIMNQYGMLALIIADEELFDILKNVYAKADNSDSIKLYLRALKNIDDKNLNSRIKELQTVLKARKKALP